MKKYFLSQRSREELRTIAKNLDVPGYEKINKGKLVKILTGVSYNELLKALNHG